MDLKVNKILIVDDSEMIREVLKEYLLEIKNYEIHEVENGNDALELMNECKVIKIPFDVIFLDLQMPVMDGLDTLKIIKKSHDMSKTKVVLISGDNSFDNIKKAKELMIDFIISKPFDFNKIKNFMTNLELPKKIKS